MPSLDGPPKSTELGTRQYCRDNVTMFSGHKVVSLCNITIFGVATPSRHRDINILRFFSGPSGSVTLSRICCREAIKLLRAQLCKNDHTSRGCTDFSRISFQSPYPSMPICKCAKSHLYQRFFFCCILYSSFMSVA